jgi:hypothetical protein
LRKAVGLLGDGSGLPYGDSTILQFDAGVGGILVEPFPDGADDDSTGASSLIMGLCIIGRADARICDAHGIALRARTHCERLYIDGFSGDGINIVANTGARSEPRANANNWRVLNSRINSCAGHGLFVRGTDANAGIAIALDVSANGKWGIYDSSFLGNTFVACHAAANRDGPYFSDNRNSRSLFLGCYSEGDQQPSKVSPPAMALGGLHGAGFDPSVRTLFIDSGLSGGLRLTNGVESSEQRGSGTLAISIGGNPDNGDILRAAIAHKQERNRSGVWRLRFADNDVVFDHENLDARRPFFVTGQGTSLRFGRSSPQPYAFVSGSAFIGNRDGARQHDYGDAAPSTGEHGRGDIVWNRSPAGGGNAGWICIKSGSPGEWRRFGEILED